MVKKGETCEALSLVFKRDRVPPQMVVNNSKEQTLGNFAKKCCDADCHLATTKLYSPWMQAAEGCIKQTKLRSLRKMLKAGLPKPLWDHCIELEA